MTAFAEITLDAMALPKAEKVKLARILLDEVDGEADATPEEIEQAWEEEIARRIQSIDDGTAEHLSLEEAMAQLRQRHPAMV